MCNVTGPWRTTHGDKIFRGSNRLPGVPIALLRGLLASRRSRRRGLQQPSDPSSPPRPGEFTAPATRRREPGLHSRRISHRTNSEAGQVGGSRTGCRLHTGSRTPDGTVGCVPEECRTLSLGDISRSFSSSSSSSPAHRARLYPDRRYDSSLFTGRSEWSVVTPCNRWSAHKSAVGERLSSEELGVRKRTRRRRRRRKGRR